MMKTTIKLFLLYFIFFLINDTIAQISVTSFEKALHDMTARVTDPIKDQNGDNCALIKIRTTQKGFVFEGDMLGITKTIQKTGEIWLYVPHGSKKLSIMHEYLGVLDNYIYPENTEESAVYIMKLSTGNLKVIVQNTGMNMEWLVIESEPSGASVYINNEFQTSLTPYSKKLDIGAYQYRVEYPDYHPYAGTVNLETGKKQNLKLELKPAFGSLQISSDPEQGASVLIDNKPTGKTTPCTIAKVLSGKHEIRLIKDLFDIANESFEITDGAQKNIQISMVPNFGNITINTDPASDIYIDGEFKAHDSWIGRLAVGNINIEAKKENHYSDSKTMAIKKGDNLKINLQPSAKTGNADIISEPMGAQVYIDNELKGETPLTIRGVLIGKYELKLQKNGFKIVSKTIKISENISSEIIEELEENEGYSANISTEGLNDDWSSSKYFTDPRDGQEYEIVIIGTQAWFAENLNYKTKNSWCYGNDAENCTKYGRLYTWDDARKACPGGWHLPSDDEWKILEMELGMSQSDVDNIGWRGTNQSEQMKSINGWNSNGNGNNSSEFNVFPAGYGNHIGSFYNLGDGGYWWSSSDGSSKNAWGRIMGYGEGRVNRNNLNKTFGLSVRCLKN